MDSYTDCIEKKAIQQGFEMGYEEAFQQGYEKALQRGFEIGYEREFARCVACLVSSGKYGMEAALDILKVPSEKRSRIRKMAEEKLANEKETE